MNSYFNCILLQWNLEFKYVYIYVYIKVIALAFLLVWLVKNDVFCFLQEYLDLSNYAVSPLWAEIEAIMWLMY